MEVVINGCWGGFSLSEELRDMYMKHIDDLRNFGEVESAVELQEVMEGLYTNDIKYRSDPYLIHLVKTLGERANGSSAKLKIIEIPRDAIKPYIENHDGMEWVAEGRTWYAEVDLEDE